MALAVALAMGAGCESRDVRARNANVILFSIDTWRADHLSLHGYPRPTTPGLERLAADAIVFDRAFSAAPQTAPSHMSMLTGVPPLAHGVMNIDKTKVVRTVPPSIRTLAEMLRARGYRTAAFTGAGNVGRGFGFDRGFDEFVQDSLGGVNGNGPHSFDPRGVIEWLARNRDERAPFFLFLHTYIPHTPYLPPPPYDTRYDPEYRGAIPSNRDEFFRQIGVSGRDLANNAFFAFFRHVDQKDAADMRHLVALYDGECNAADDAVAGVLRAVGDAGLGRETILVLTSDHGEEFLEHGSLIHPGELWDELIRVPLVVTTPRTRGRGRRIATPVSGLDIVPTILDLVGTSPDAQPLGRSLVPLMEGEDASAERPVLSEFLVSVKPGTATFEPTQWLRSLRTSRYKLIRRFGAETSDALYDLETDPGETRSVRDDPAVAAVLEQLRAGSDAIDRAEGSLRAPAGESAVPEETLSELRALGYVQ